MDTYAAAPGKNPPASIVFRDGTDQIRSDFGGSYNNGANGAAVYFVSNGNVVLDLSASRRAVYLDFSNPAGTVTSAPPTGNYLVYLSNNVVGATNTCLSGTGLLGMGIGDVANSCLWANFTDSLGRSWAIRFAPPNNPGSTWARATRVDSFNWMLETMPGDVAALVLVGKNTQTVTGYFYMTTKLSITKQ